MSVNSISTQPVNLTAAQPRSPALNALSSTLDVASQMTQLMNSVLMNVLRSAQQAPSMGTPGLGTPGLGTPGLGGPGQVPGSNGLGGIAGLLQSFAGLLQSVAPLLQALSGNNFGANGPAQQLGNQFPGGGLGVGPAVSGLGGGLGNAGAQIGSAIGGAVGGVPGAQLGASIGNVAGTAAGVALGANGVNGLNNGFVPVATVGIGSGVMTTDAARAWALANGGANQTASDIQQGMNLYSIFNTGDRMFNR